MIGGCCACTHHRHSCDSGNRERLSSVRLLDSHLRGNDGKMPITAVGPGELSNNRSADPYFPFLSSMFNAEEWRKGEKSD